MLVLIARDSVHFLYPQLANVYSKGLNVRSSVANVRSRTANKEGLLKRTSLFFISRAFYVNIEQVFYI